MRTRHLASAALLVAGAAGCGERTASAADSTAAIAAARTLTDDASLAVPQPGAPNTLTPDEQKAGWQLLFDGRTTQGWRGYGKPAMPDSGWSVVDGALTLTGRGGDIVATQAFRDFELALEWKIAPGGNSGVFYRTLESRDPIYFSAPEMQVLDDAAHADGKSPLTSAGSAFGLYPVPRGLVKPAGEWNAARLVVHGDSVEHWLNGQRAVAYAFGSADWKARVAASKFAAWKAFGTGREGLIGLQDHGDRVQFRSIKLRVLR
jgi:hypothetical protein